MQWIEIIRLRTQPDVEPSVIKWLKDLIHSLGGTPGLDEARVYTTQRSPGTQTSHDVGTMQEIFTESEVGLMVAETLKKYGILDHTVWLMKGKNGHRQVTG